VLSSGTVGEQGKQTAFRRLRASFGEASSRTLVAGAVALGLLLAVLATLQYRWLGQVGEAEAVQLRAGARSRSEQLAREFDRELTRAMLWLAVDAETAASGDGSRYAQRWNRWVKAGPQSALVREVYLVTAGTVRRFSPEAGIFSSCECPEALQELCVRALSVVEPASAAKPRRSRYPMDPLDDAIPAVVAPILCEPTATQSDPGPPEQRLVGLTVLRLDGGWIRDRFLLELAERHFGGADQTDFGLTVARRTDGSKPLFQFGPQGSREVPDGDARVGLFELRFEEMTPADFDGFVTPGGRPHHMGPRPFRGDSGRWQLVATHRNGSVDVVVAAAKRRNLAVVGGILALLAASGVLVIRSAQRARRMANRQLEFVATVSHELRTPLAVICSAGENLADGIVSDSATVREYGGVVRDEGRRLARMVERVLDFAGSYSGRRLLHLERTELQPFLDECAAAAAPALAEAGLVLERSDAEGLPDVNADRGALRRVIVNLVENAAKHGGEGGLVRLQVETSRSAPGAPVVQISVSDRGPGIPKDELASVFEPFFRGREAVRRQVPGSGLGLCLVDRIVRSHGGRVSVRSAPGAGSTFTVTLPALLEEGP